MEKLFVTEKWGFRETLVITVALFIAGLLLQLTVPLSGTSAIHFPYTAYTAIAIVNILVLLFFGLRKTAFIQWLSSIPAAIASITYLGILSLAMGFILQDPADGGFMGIHSLLTTWYFLFAMLFFLSSLGMATLKRLVPFRWRNVGFLLNHLGLWIAVFAGMIGSGDIQNLSIPLHLHQTTNLAYDQDGSSYKLAYSLRLESFTIEEYPAEPVLITKGVTQKYFRPSKADPANDSLYRYGNIDITVHQRLMSAHRSDSIYAASDSTGACQALEVTLTDHQTGQHARGWIANSTETPAFVQLETIAVGLSSAEPKRYSSLVTVLKDGAPDDTVRIEVNSPHKIGSLNLYQYSYDTKQGRWSQLSVLQAVYDPWIGLVYLGLFMVIAGSLYLLFTRTDDTNQPNTDQL